MIKIAVYSGQAKLEAPEVSGWRGYSDSANRLYQSL